LLAEPKKDSKYIILTPSKIHSKEVNLLKTYLVDNDFCFYFNHIKVPDIKIFVFRV
jgi:hypothetical protein